MVVVKDRNDAEVDSMARYADANVDREDGVNQGEGERVKLLPQDLSNAQARRSLVVLLPLDRRVMQARCRREIGLLYSIYVSFLSCNTTLRQNATGHACEAGGHEG